MNEHIVKAVEYFGSDAAMARALNVSKTAIKKMKCGVIRVTAERAVQIDLVTDGHVPKYEIRSDLFDKPFITE